MRLQGSVCRLSSCLLYNQRLNLIFRDRLIFESEIDTSGLSTRVVYALIFHLAEFGEVRMLQCLLRREALGRIEEEQLLQQVDSLRLCTSEATRQVNFRLEGQRAEVRARAIVVDLFDFLLGRCADHVENDVQLIELIGVSERIVVGREREASATREQRTTRRARLHREKLREDAA